MTPRERADALRWTLGSEHLTDVVENAIREAVEAERVICAKEYASWEQRLHLLEAVAGAARTMLICDYQDAIYAHAELKSALEKLIA